MSTNICENCENCTRNQTRNTEIASLNVDGNTYRLACLTNVDELQNIRTAWHTLERNNRESFIYFQSYDWCHQWCVHHLESEEADPEMQLHIYVLWNADKIVMVWPMVRVRSRAGARILVSLTDPLGQYSNVLVDRAQVTEKLGCSAWKAINKHAGVDAITLNNFPLDSFLDRILCGFGYVERSSSSAAILDLTGFETWEDHEASYSRSTRKSRKRRRARLEKEGALAYEVIPGGTRRFAALVEQTLEMKRAWLEQTGRRSNPVSSSVTESFLTDLTGTECNASGLPEGAFVHALALDGTPIATEIGMVKDRHYYSFLGAFDLHWQDYSPGKVQIEMAQRWAKSVGIEKFDFLGDPSSYKSHWTGTAHPLRSRSIPLTPLGLIYCAIWKARLRPTLKSAYHNMSPNRRRLFTKLLGFAAGNRKPAPVLPEVR